MALNALTAFARGQSWRARRGNRDGEFSGTADPVPYGCPGRGCSLDSPGHRAAGTRSAGDSPSAGNPEMAKWRNRAASVWKGSIRARKWRPAPGPSIRKPAACSLRSAAERPMRVARCSQGGPCGSRSSPRDSAPRRPSPQAMGGMLAGRRASNSISILGVEFS